MFEEVNHDLELAFSYTWMNSEAWGFVRHCRLRHLRKVGGLEVRVMDGLSILIIWWNLERISAAYLIYRRCSKDRWPF